MLMQALSDTEGRARAKKYLSVLMPKMAESEMRRVHSWQMDRVVTESKATAYDIIQNGVAQLAEQRKDSE